MNVVNDLPDAFCWTKMGTEAGQSLNAIIERKDMERELGEGLFFWGIGTALGQKIWEFIDSGKQPYVLFSPMKSKPKQIDVNPEKLFVWTSYIDRWGEKHEIPETILVTSRGNTETAKKGNHYALVCWKDSSLREDMWPAVDWARLRNYKGSSKLGFSQVTALVEYEKSMNPSSKCYDVLFSAKLIEPYYVKLSDPVELPYNISERYIQI